MTESGVLSLMLPFVGLLSAAALGLVTLRKGPRDGLMVMGFASVATALIATVAIGSPWTAGGIVLVLWLPLWGLAVVLRATRSLGFTAQLAALGGLIVVLVIHLVTGDPTAYWQQLLEPVRQALVVEGLVAAEGSQLLLGQWSRWMTGAFAAALVLQYLMSLFLARWWQARLYNPGGFGQEFRRLAVGRVVGLLFLALVIWAVGVKGGGLALDLIPVLFTLLTLQGLAVAHRVRELLGARQAWLLGLYILLILFLPQVGLFLQQGL